MPRLPHWRCEIEPPGLDIRNPGLQKVHLLCEAIDGACLLHLSKDYMDLYGFGMDLYGSILIVNGLYACVSMDLDLY